VRSFRGVNVADIRCARPAAKRVNPHYLTPDHRAWRDAVLTRAGHRCQWPGCGKRERVMYADHIVELEDDGAPLELNNGQCLCAAHHTVKTNMRRTARHKG
jgi:5-methylcytosine-specific restriction protein A